MSPHPAATTPGPWIIDHAPRDWAMSVATVYGTPKKDGDVFHCYVEISGNAENQWGPWNQQSPEVRLANARLIASAPEIFSAPQSMVEVFGTHGSCFSVNARTAALTPVHSALSHATGQSLDGQEVES